MDKQFLGLYVEPEIKEALKIISKSERRTISAQVTLIIEQWLERNEWTRKENGSEKRGGDKE